MQRRVVVFPQPLGPRSTRNSPGSISRSRLSIATIGDLPPNRFVSPRMLTLDIRASPAFGKRRGADGVARSPRSFLRLEQRLPACLERRDLRGREVREVRSRAAGHRTSPAPRNDRTGEMLDGGLPLLRDHEVGEELGCIRVRRVLEDHPPERRVPCLAVVGELEVDRRALLLLSRARAPGTNGDAVISPEMTACIIVSDER